MVSCETCFRKLGEVKNLNKKVLGIVLVLAASFAVASVATAFACNFNEPEDVVINYWTGGYGTVATPSGWRPVAFSLED
jgi:hypothetical protein